MHSTWVRCLLLSAILTIGVTSDVTAQGAVRGVIVHEITGEGVAGVTVQYTARRLRAVSNELGQFVLADVPSGTRELIVQRIGYQVTAAIVQVVDGDTTDITIVMRPAATRLRDIVVSPGRFGVLDAPVVANQTLSREDIETIPQVGEDIFRAVKRLPGLAAGDISTRLNVRGGLDPDLLVKLDGVELYEPYHLKDFDGALGIIDIYSVGSVDLLTGGFSVEEGDHTAGLFSMRSRVPPTSRTRTTLGVSITNFSLMNQGAFSSGRGQWLVSARRGYLDIALKLTGGDDNLSPVYWDAFGKLEYQVGARHRLSFNTLHAFDDLNYADFDEDGLVKSRWWSNYGWMTWAADWSDRVSMRTTVWGTRVNSNRGGWFDELNRIRGPEQVVVDDSRSLEVAGLRTDVTATLTEQALVKFGFEAMSQRADYAYRAESRSIEVVDGDLLTARFDTVDFNLNPTGEELSGYAAFRVRPVSRLTAEAGLRYDRISHADDDNVAPRVLASLDLSDGTTVRGSWGRYYQSHGLHQLDVGDGELLYHSSDRADQIAIGLQHRIADVVLRIEGYRRRYADQRPRYVSRDREIDPFQEAEWDRLRIDPDVGEARGLEVFVQKESGDRWAWSVSYALSEAKDLIGGQWVHRTFDQRHALTLSVAYRPNARWHITTAFHYHSGWPITESLFAADTLADGSVQLRRMFGQLNAARLPAYHRVDLRITRNFPIGGSTLQAYLDMFNVYNRTNLRSYFYWVNYNNGQLVSGRDTGEELLPLLPSVGLRWEF